MALPLAGRGAGVVLTTSVRRDAGPDIEHAYGTEAPWALDLGVDYRIGLGRNRGSSLEFAGRYQAATLQAPAAGFEAPAVYGLSIVWRVGSAERGSGWSGELSQRFGSLGLNGMLQSPMMQSLAPTIMHRLESMPVVGARAVGTRSPRASSSQVRSPIRWPNPGAGP